MTGSQNSPNPPGGAAFAIFCIAILVVACFVRIMGWDLSLENIINNVF